MDSQGVRIPRNETGNGMCVPRWTAGRAVRRHGNYAEAVELPVLDEREDAVLVEESYLSFYETLVCETNLPLNNGQTVVWLNPAT